MDIKSLFTQEGETTFLKMLGDVPFGHSAYQIENIIMNETDANRQYRQGLLELKDKYIALKECHFRRRKIELELRKAEKKLKAKDSDMDEDDRELIQIEIEEKHFNLTMENKLVADAIAEFTLYMSLLSDILKKHPELETREGFEKMEPEYWKKRAVRQAQRDVQSIGTIGQGNIELLQKLGFDSTVVLLDLQSMVTHEKAAITEQRKLQLEAATKENRQVLEKKDKE